MICESEGRNPVEALGEAYLERCRNGDCPTVEEYASAHPTFADDIRRLFPTILAMEDLKSCRLSSETPARFNTEVKQLGDCRITREIGRGGMGVVYEAEQQSLQRFVAVKVFPRQTFGNSTQLERFYQEARTAGQLHHTNIVPVFGVGEQDGLHYYVMQRIYGIGIDQVIRDVSHAVEIAERTQPANASNVYFRNLAFQRELDCECPVSKIRFQDSYWQNVADVGIQVAEALGYAHTQGFQHRDVKPSNLLLDAQGTVWVTDFGLATTIGGERLSNPGDVVGTLRYMAPEHVAGEQDSRSDLYSLGVTLYELLTLTSPFGDKDRNTIVRRIVAGDVEPPRKLCSEIPRDLEAVVLKAIAHDPQQRYQTADELAADLRRFREDRPVLARKIHTMGRVTRWARRNPTVAMLSTTLVLFAIISLSIVGVQWQEAVQEGQRAENNLMLALESMDQLLERFGASWMDHPAPPTGSVANSATGNVEIHLAVSNYGASVLRDALRFYDQFDQQNANNPQLRKDMAKVHRRVGDIYQRLGQFQIAEKAYKRALQVLRAPGVDLGEQQITDKAIVLNQLGLTYYATSRIDEAEGSFRQSLTLLKSLPDESAFQRYELARASNNLGLSLWLLRRPEEAAASHRRAIFLLESLTAEHPEDVDYRLALARAYRIYYPFLAFSPARDRSDRIREAGIRILEGLVREFPGVPDYQCELSEMLSSTSRNRIEQLETAVDLSHELCDQYPSIPRYRVVLAGNLLMLAKARSRINSKDSQGYFERSVDTYRSLAIEFQEIPAYQMFLALALYSHSKNLFEMDEIARSVATVEESIEAQHRLIQLHPRSHFGRRLLKRQYQHLADMLEQLGDTERSMHALEAARRYAAPEQPVSDSTT